MSRKMKSAVEWFARLRSSDVTCRDQREYEKWLAEDDSRLDEYLSMEQDWQDLDGLESWARSELSQLNLQSAVKSRRRNGWMFGGLSAAAAAMLAVIMVSTVPGTAVSHYETTEAEQRKLALDDGSQIHLNTESAVEVRYSKEIREVYLEKGEGIFDVGHDRTRPFVVRAGNNSVIAIGTRFSVYLEHGELLVTVLEGKVAVVPRELEVSDAVSQIEKGSIPAIQDKDPERIFLEPDRQVRIGKSGRVEELKEVVASQEAAWQEGKLIFEGTPLREVVEQISRYVTGEVRVADDVPDYPVTGIIQIRSVETMVSLLSEVVPITAIKESSQVTTLYDET